MPTVPCLRCCKLVPESAAFCRRCGAALGAGRYQVKAAPKPSAQSLSAPPAVAVRWPGLLVRSGLFASVAAVLTMFVASSRLAPPPRGMLVTPAEESVDMPAGTDTANAPDVDAMLARVRERVAETQDRVAAARERLESARRRFEARVAPPALPGLQDAPRVVEPPPILQPVAAPGPHILSLSDRYGGAGKRIQLRGRGLATATRVYMVAPGDGRDALVWTEAGFRMRDDGCLVVTVPDLGPAERTGAAFVVVTRDGAAVTVPSGRDAAADVLVASAGNDLAPRPGGVLVVERGGSVRSAAGSLVLVRAGGGVERARADCFILRETSRPEPRDLSVTPVLDVRALHACPVDALFRYGGRQD